MMKYRYVLWMLCVFCIGINVSLLASPLYGANISTIDIEKIVNKDIEKLTPELVQDIFRGAITGVNEKTILEILQKGTDGEIPIVSLKDIEIIIEKNISGLTPKIFQKIIRGEYHNIKEKIILIVLQKGILGEISGVTANTIAKMIGKDFQGLSPKIVQSIILDSIGGGIPGLVDDDSLKIIKQNIKNFIPRITALEIEKMIKNGISGLPSQIFDNIIKDIITSGTVTIDPKYIVDEVKQWVDINIEEVSYIPRINENTPKDIQVAIERWRKKIEKNPMIGLQGLDDLPYDSQKSLTHWPRSSDTTSNKNLGDECLLKTTPWFGVCGEWSCDIVLECAMGKERDAIEARLDDLINTIKANTKQTEHQTKIIEQEVLAYKRLEARVRKEALSLKEARYLSNKIKDSVSIGSTIQTSKKGQ